MNFKKFYRTAYLIMKKTDGMCAYWRNLGLFFRKKIINFILRKRTLIFFMDKKTIKELLRKTRSQNRRETGKRYLTKGQLHDVLKCAQELTIPEEDKTFQERGIKTVGQILQGFGKQQVFDL